MVYKTFLKTNHHYFLNVSIISILILWMIGFGHYSFIPIFIFLLIFFIKKNKISDYFVNISKYFTIPSKLPVYLYLFFSIWIISVYLLRYYSLHWRIWDVGIHSNILYNLAFHGEYYSSFLGIHGLGDHFTPSFALLSYFYKISPNLNWLMLAKALAYISCPFLIWQISKHLYSHSGKHSDKSIIGLWVGLFWLILYKPSVESLYFSFQPSSLSLPFILLSFIFLLKKRWFWFSLTMIFLLGFKENLPIVWIAIGFFLIVDDSLQLNYRKLGFVLMVLGFLFIYVIPFELMPLFRQSATFHKVDNIGPLEKIPEKIEYIFLLFTPLFFLPIIFFRQGSIAFPSIGLSLITNNSSILSTKFHYDDVNSVLLMIAMIIIFSKKGEEISRFFKSKFSFFFLLFGIATLLILPNRIYTMLPRESIFVETVKSIPNEWDLLKLQKIKELNKIDESYLFVTYRNIGSYIYRKKDLALSDTKEKYREKVVRDTKERDCVQLLPQDEKKIMVILDMSENLNNWVIQDTERCYSALQKSPQYKEIENDPLQIFKKIE